ncbi:NAD-P-binding protein [Sistotremastrum niveocremeum HHB9708]|uniref:NAD-P-binding protein n=1 Tax=Sistotremastrum niveocremeum HHB9708 TaxID=1314777 RepID=A0A164V3Z0_9AGAM|nr:NAD-P-binding protein [Sistotremastrum niveocremeum HHB9708]
MSATLDPANVFNVQGLVAIVSGGGTGIGLMITKALESNGATVFIIGRRLEVLEKAAKEHAVHGKIIPIQGDVSSKSDLLVIAEKIKAQTGYINFLVNNSGVLGPEINPQSWPAFTPDSGHSIKETQEFLWNNSTEEQFNQVFNVNVTAVWFATIAFLELLEAGNKPGNALPGVTSQVVTVSSVVGYFRSKQPYAMAYNISKAGATFLGKQLATMLADFDIRSNVIAPGPYPSEMTVKFSGMVDDTPRAFVPLRRFGNTEDMAGLILYLASRAGAFASGGVFLTDGGALGQAPSSY